MSSRAVASLQQRVRGNTGAGKKSDVVVKAIGGNNRRVLGDIQNVVSNRAVEGNQKHEQVNGPRIRSSGVQLQLKAQPVLVGNINKKKQLAVVGAETALVWKAVAATRKVAIQNKVINKPKPEQVIATAENKSQTLKASPVKLTKRKVHTLTGVLTARSKAACGATNKPKDPIVNIDAADVDNHLAVVEYVDDIYKFYKLAEGSSQLDDYMYSQPDINEKMRAILVDWLIEVHYSFKLMPESLYLTINIIDRFLSMKTLMRKDLQLLGITAMLIASKYEEIWAPEVKDFVSLTNGTCNQEQVLEMEKLILGKIEWNLTVPTPYVFLVRFMKAAESDHQLQSMTFFLAELALMHYATSMYSPSIVAASAVYAARCTLNKCPIWTETLKLHTSFSGYQLLDCAKLLAQLHSGLTKNKLQVIYRKYSNSDNNAVALLPPAKILLT